MKNVNDEFILIEGQQKGPTSIILAGVHGNEKCGPEVFERIIPGLIIDRGRVWFGFGNPWAIRLNKRFVEANLNRMFDEGALSDNQRGSYEYARAQFIKQYLLRADMLLDIHASSVRDSKPFVICEENARSLVQYLPVDLVVSGFDRVEPGGTDYYMNIIGRIGICIECGYLGDLNSVELAKEAISAFLCASGHNQYKEMFSREQKRIDIYWLYKTRTDRFTLIRQFADFEELSTGQLIGIDGGSDVRAEEDSIILFAHDREKAGEEAFLLGRQLRTP